MFEPHLSFAGHFSTVCVKIPFCQSGGYELFRSDLGSSTASLSWVIDGALTTKGYPAETFNETLVTRMAVAMAEDGSKAGFWAHFCWRSVSLQRSPTPASK